MLRSWIACPLRIKNRGAHGPEADGVLNAIAWLALYGFLDRLRRIVRTTGLLGPRVRQTSNACVLCFPKGLGGLAANVFGFAPESNNWTPSNSNSEVKKGFQGSEVLDLGLGIALGRLGASVASVLG